MVQQKNIRFGFGLERARIYVNRGLTFPSCFRAYFRDSYFHFVERPRLKGA
jgi:hypothetical protein